MKILQIITKSNWGGAQRHVFDLSMFLKEKGYDIAVALGGNGILKEKLDSNQIRTLSISTMGRDISVGKDTMSLWAIFEIIKKERPDVIHYHSAKASGFSALSGLILGVKKRIYTVHGFAFNEDRPRYEKLLIAFFTWLTILFSTDVINLSQNEYIQSRFFPWSDRKLHLIPLGISPIKFLTRKDALAFFESKIGVVGTTEPQKRVIVGTVAELHKNKGLTYAINAIEKLRAMFPQIVFFIIGEGEDRVQLESLIESKKLSKNVILAGYVADASKYLKGFDIYLVSSVKEGLPYTVLEAGLAGLPVLSTTVGGIPEVIDDMRSGVLIQPKKSEEIISALEFMLKNKTIIKDYGKALQEKVETKFSQKESFEKVMGLY